MKQLFLIIKWLVILTLVLGSAVLILASVKVSRPFQTSPAEFKMFAIEPGASTRTVANRLESEGIIGRAWYFELYLYLKNKSGQIQAGKYQLSGNLSIREIAGLLIRGEVVFDSARLTVIEGWTVADIARAVADIGTVKYPEFLRANQDMEGYLFPDTYFVDPAESAEEIGKKMRLNFDKKAGAVKRETLILASIVEREIGRNASKGQKLSERELARVQEERRMAAGVFLNRLALGMKLQSDATVTYITGSKNSRATFQELEIESPYNTYKHAGLPPGPISNPGLDAIRAAQNPAETDYLFFVTAPDGTAYFGRTLKEHEENKARYLK